MNTQPGIQTSFPWQEGPVPLQPVDNDVFSVVDNRYLGEGFAFIIQNQAQSDRWKNTQHYDFYTREEAQTLRDRFNTGWGQS